MSSITVTLSLSKGVALRSLLALALCGCAPATVSHCTVRMGAKGNATATLTLSNRSWKRIVHAEVLIDALVLRSQGGDGLFDARTDVGPAETRTFDAWPLDRKHYDFKSGAGGCELEQIIFSDGTSWEMGSPL